MNELLLFAALTLVAVRLYGPAWYQVARNWTLDHLYQLPNFAALPIARRIELYAHTFSESKCSACLGRNRIAHAKHKETEGPRSLYCFKCGLDKHATGDKDVITWPEYCANRVVKVNNPKHKPGLFRNLSRLAFWD